ncbi:CBASS cGAMP-activated phospholipase [Bradyrhizobium liaoningense]|uniref:CBASS cGAMP-activated phospholipase n=1 Tax=Bradyrhizobium liaoningense TaxID=43992 RepID=UPI001BAD260F|nr:CBASS cGAMP-activated phospholipase [Bradyrhizobium liaoningense]MBR1030302.1 patatin-like phospholipase family protein [Bradyrhizobium liaoningense]
MSFQILALSGGGYRGLFTSSILMKLEAQAKKPLAECFDLIAGTSIGGVIGLGLALGKSAESIRQMFIDHGEAIFTRGEPPTSRFGKWKAFRSQWSRPKYDGTVLREKIEAVVGPTTRLGDARTRLLIPSVNMTKGSVQMFKTAHHPNFMNDHKLLAADVAMATAAAPLYFPMAKIENSNFIDGGVVANAPDMCAVHEAVHFLGQEMEDIHVLSIGTTTSKFSLPSSLGRDFGQKLWLENGRLISTILSSQQQLVDFMLKHQLADRYIRFDEQPSPEQTTDLGLDLATANRRQTLIGMADGCYQALSNNPRVIEMLAHRRPDPKFHH